MILYVYKSFFFCYPQNEMSLKYSNPQTSLVRLASIVKSGFPCCTSPNSSSCISAPCLSLSVFLRSTSSVSSTSLWWFKNGAERRRRHTNTVATINTHTASTPTVIYTGTRQAGEDTDVSLDMLGWGVGTEVLELSLADVGERKGCQCYFNIIMIKAWVNNNMDGN